MFSAHYDRGLFYTHDGGGFGSSFSKWWDCAWWNIYAVGSWPVWQWYDSVKTSLLVSWRISPNVVIFAVCSSTCQFTPLGGISSRALYGLLLGFYVPLSSGYLKYDHANWGNVNRLYTKCWGIRSVRSLRMLLQSEKWAGGGPWYSDFRVTRGDCPWFGDIHRPVVKRHWVNYSPRCYFRYTAKSPIICTKNRGVIG